MQNIPLSELILMRNIPISLLEFFLMQLIPISILEIVEPFVSGRQGKTIVLKELCRWRKELRSGLNSKVTIQVPVWRKNGKKRHIPFFKKNL